MTTAEKLTLITENEQKIYSKGKSEGYTNGYFNGKSDELLSFWNDIQESGERTDYVYAFAGWTSEMKQYFMPLFKIKPYNAYGMFAFNNAIDDLPKLCEEHNITIDFQWAGSLDYAFYQSGVTRIGTINTMSCSSLNSVFTNCRSLETIDLLVLNDNTYTTQTFSTNLFVDCSQLKNITIQGTIYNDIHFGSSSNLTKESVNSIVSALTTNSKYASGKTIYFSNHNYVSVYVKQADNYEAALNAGWKFVFQDMAS